MIKKIKIFAFLFFLSCWSFRLFKINQIISSGFLFDFKAYYLIAKELFNVNPNLDLIAKTSYGPPFVILPFLPFSLLPFKISEYAVDFLNLISWFLIFYLLWKKEIGKTNSIFWLLLGASAFSFPLIFSLGMGNPIGFVALGIYGFCIFKNKILQILTFSLSWTLKIFPAVAAIPQVFVSNKKQKRPRAQGLVMIILSIIFVGILSFIFLPPNSWGTYLDFAGKLKTQTIIPDPIIYNQSLSSSAARLGIYLPSFSVWHILFAVSLIALIIKKYSKLKPLDATVALVALSLLIHPFPWQHYFAVFLPYILIKIGNLDYKYIFVYFLISLNWGGSQFFGTLLLFLFILLSQYPRLSASNPR